MKWRKKESLEKLLKTHASFNEFKGEKSYKENGQWRGRGGCGRDEVIPINSTMKISYQSFRGRGQEDVEDMEPIEVQME